MITSCKKATELIEKRNVIPLSLSESVWCRVHLLFCKTCSIFEKDSKAIDVSLKKMMEAEEGDEMIKLPEDKKAIIKGKI